MIRINLLPIKKQQEKESGRRMLVLFVLLLLGQSMVLWLMYNDKAGDLDTEAKKVSEANGEIENLKKDVADVEKHTKEKILLEEQIGVLDQLEQGRVGPVRILDELQLMLSLPRNELEKLTQAKKGWNSKWDPSRLWFSSFGERDGKFVLSGGGRTNDDVAEFLQRLSTSVFFDKVRLGPVAKTGSNDFEFVTFEITGSISYSLGAPASAPEGG
jgi:type IV pilus assembly protein PilN